jgi:hypothetical protein
VLNVSKLVRSQLLSLEVPSSLAGLAPPKLHVAASTNEHSTATMHSRGFLSPGRHERGRITDKR